MRNDHCGSTLVAEQSKLQRGEIKSLVMKAPERRNDAEDAEEAASGTRTGAAYTCHREAISNNSDSCNHFINTVEEEATSMGENENILFILQDELEYSLAALQQIEDQRQEAQIKHEACKAALELELEAITVERDALLRDRQERGHGDSGNVQDVQTMKILHDDLECSLDALECLQEQHENLQKNREAQEAATKYDMEVLAAERDALLRERQERNKAQESSVALDLVKNSEALRDARKVCASQVRYKKQLEAKKKEKLELEIDLASKISTVVALEEAKRRSSSEPTASENAVLSQGLRSYVENCTSCPSKTVNIDIEATERRNCVPSSTTAVLKFLPWKKKTPGCARNYKNSTATASGTMVPRSCASRVLYLF